MTYYALVMNIETVNPGWTTSYALWGPFDDENKAREYTTKFPPLLANGIHSVTQVLPVDFSDGPGSCCVLVMQSYLDQWAPATESTPKLIPILWGPYASREEAEYVQQKHTFTTGRENDMAMVIDAQDPNWFVDPPPDQP